MRPQESRVWDLPTQKLIDRIQASENQTYSHGRDTSDIQGAINVVDAKITTTNTGVEEYKKYVRKVHSLLQRD